MIPVDDRHGAARRRGLHVKLANLLTCCAVIAGLVAAPARLHAQPVDAPNIAGGENMPWNKGVPQDVRAAAREAFLEGNRLFKIPLFSRAVEKYAEALEKWKHPAFYFNLAIAQINLGQWLEAREDLELAMKYGPDPLRADRFEEARKQLVEVEHHLGRIRVSSPTSGAEITLDGAPLFTGPGQREIWVTARAHEVTAKKEDFGTQARRVAVAPGAHETVELSLRRMVLEDPPKWKYWTLVAAGAGVAAASGVLHGVSAHDFSTFDSGFAKLSCASDGCKPEQIDSQLNSRLNRARLEQKIAVGGYIASGALVATGAVLLYFARPRLVEQEETASRGGLSLAPVVSRDMLGVVVTVSP
jgi:tetratricopeptide (TPR) repeat protein